MKSNRHKKSSKLLTLLCSIAFMGLLSSAAHAGPILGSLSYNGFVAPETGLLGGTPTTLGLATWLNFTSPSSGAIGGGALSVLTGGATLTLFDFAIAPLTGTLATPTPVWAQLLGVGDFAFGLTSLTINTQNNAVLVLSGDGVFTATGFDDTDAVWSLTAQDFGTGLVVSFSASNAVPEPSVLTLLGLTLLGLAWTRRRAKVRPASAKT